MVKFENEVLVDGDNRVVGIVLGRLEEDCYRVAWGTTERGLSVNLCDGIALKTRQDVELVSAPDLEHGTYTMAPGWVVDNRTDRVVGYVLQYIAEESVDLLCLDVQFINSPYDAPERHFWSDFRKTMRVSSPEYSRARDAGGQRKYVAYPALPDLTTPDVQRFLGACRDGKEVHFFESLTSPEVVTLNHPFLNLWDAKEMDPDPDGGARVVVHLSDVRPALRAHTVLGAFYILTDQGVRDGLRTGLASSREEELEFMHPDELKNPPQTFMDLVSYDWRVAEYVEGLGPVHEKGVSSNNRKEIVGFFAEGIRCECGRGSDYPVHANYCPMYSRS